jgi:hypothetical protein
LSSLWLTFSPKIDYVKLATTAGYTVGSAKTTMGTIKRKLKEAAGETLSGSPARGSPAKRKATSDDVVNSPTKRSKDNSSKVSKTRDFEIAEDEEDDINLKTTLKMEEKEDGKKGTRENTNPFSDFVF